MNDFRDQPKDVWPQPGEADFSAYLRGGMFGAEHAREEALLSLVSFKQNESENEK